MKRLIIDDAIPFLEGRLENDFECIYMPGEKITRDDLLDADGLLVRTRTRCDRNLLEGTPVKFVATGTIGLDHIDTHYCDSAGIRWQNAPGCNAPAVAQYVWRALLELGFDPKRMTLGVVGKGNVGSVVVDWGRRLGAKVIVCDPPRAERGLKDEDYIPLQQLMSEADAVSFHTPLIKSAGLDPFGYFMQPTLHLADEAALKCLRPGAILVNAARGGVVDEVALGKIRDEKGLKTAIDTWEGEPRLNPAHLPFADIATFHIAGYSRQGKERATYAILAGLEKHFGIVLPKDNLEAPYKASENLSEASIIASYDIKGDDRLMRKEYPDFERLRNTYPLREETESIGKQL